MKKLLPIANGNEFYHLTKNMSLNGKISRNCIGGCSEQECKCDYVSQGIVRSLSLEFVSDFNAVALKDASKTCAEVIKIRNTGTPLLEEYSNGYYIVGPFYLNTL